MELLFYLIGFPLKGASQLFTGVFNVPDINVLLLQLPALLLAIFLASRKKVKIYKPTTILSLFIALYVVINTVGFWGYEQKHHLFGVAYLKALGVSTVGYAFSFYIGIMLIERVGDERFSRFTFTVWLGMTFLVFASALQTGGGLFVKGISTYLSISDAYAMTSLVALFFLTMKNNIEKNLLSYLMVFGVSVVALFALVSRTSLYAFFIAASIPFVYYVKLKSRRMLGYLFGLFVVLFLVFPILSPFFESSETGWWSYDRMFRLFSGEEDNSLSERSILLQLGLQKLSESWIYGDYFAHATAYAGGSYIHSYLSFWLEYGVFPFILLLVIMFKSFYVIVKESTSARPGIGRLRSLALLSISIFLVLSATLSRAHWYTYIWIMPGMAHMIMLTHARRKS